MEVDIIIILFSIITSAFFSGMEIAFISANKLHIELEKKRKGFFPNILGKITQNSSKFITTMLVGNNISLVIYSYFMGKVIVSYLGMSSILLQTFISTLIILVTAEFLPKAIFRVYANETLKLFSLPAYFFYVILYSFSYLINGISDFFLKFIFSADKDDHQTAFSKEELGNYITEQLENGNDNEEEIDTEIQIFQNALEFQKVKAREIMVPRTEILAIEIHETVSKLSELFIKSGYSKILVYKTSLDDIIGHVNAFELFKKPKTIKSILLPIEIVPESMMISDVLNSLTRKRKSIAVVVDEYGGTSGMITVEDVVEELFGEIEDEHDIQELIDERINDNEFKLSARLEIDYLNEEYNLNIPKEEAYETLGGFIINQTENIPQKGEELYISNYKIIILNVSSSKIEEISLKILDAQEN
jgi:CBS domain containing-hemolysin-like protein